ncbi:MAG: dihydroxy-acid dehydratase [Candidatus Hadarchaeum sp.]|uniref:dihydroxy-acid dehydratase n=1 Tax=Candidatus Hadarchaeum sp. TaxID=2883567 RepID=UPI003176E8F4
MRRNKNSWNRQKEIPYGVEKVVRQSLLYSCKLRKGDFDKPWIGVITQAHALHPGEYHLTRVARAIAEVLRKEGAVPVLFNVPGHCDGIIAPKQEYIFAQRNLIVDCIEVIAESYFLDGLILLASCDKNVPAALMAAGRLDLPTVMVTGGVMPLGQLSDGRAITIDDVNQIVGKSLAGKVGEREENQIIKSACPGRGACPIMTTGTTMQIVAEALGMSLPLNATVVGESRELFQIGSEAAKCVLDLWERQITARQIITLSSIKNAIKVCLAVGGSMHALYHIPAVGLEAGIDVDYWSLFDEYSHEVPVLVGIKPNGPFSVHDFNQAGGVPAVVATLHEFLDLQSLTIMGKPIGEYVHFAKFIDRNVIRPLDNPWSRFSGLAVLKGNLADAAVVRTAGVKASMMRFEAPCKVFNDLDSARRWLREVRPREPIALIIRYQGLKGGPGIRSLLKLSAEVIGMGLEDNVAIVTDGRFSGGARGLCVGLVTPEAADGGNIAVVEERDVISIDIGQRSINIRISETELEKRRRLLPKEIIAKETSSPFLRSFLALVQPLPRGGITGVWQR